VTATRWPEGRYKSRSNATMACKHRRTQPGRCPRRYRNSLKKLYPINGHITASMSTAHGTEDLPQLLTSTPQRSVWSGMSHVRQERYPPDFQCNQGPVRRSLNVPLTNAAIGKENEVVKTVQVQQLMNCKANVRP